MTGTLYGLPLSQRVDINGIPLSGCLLYLYAANTTTPVNSFQDFALTLINPNPLVADASGMLPEFWLADGSYRARLTDASGTPIFDRLNISAIGPSSGGGGGGGGTVDPTAIANTGDFIWLPVKGIIRSGWVMSDSRTIGSVSSGAGQRANADTQALYIYLWNNFTDSLCHVTPGRGGSGLADFNSNKPIATLDMRSWGIFGLDDMGATPRGGITSGTPTVAASSVGTDKSSITIAQANLPSFNLDTSGLIITNTFSSNTNILRGGNTSASASAGGQANIAQNQSQVTVSATSALSGNLPSGGSGTALTPTTISPGRFGTFYVKL